MPLFRKKKDDDDDGNSGSRENPVTPGQKKMVPKCPVSSCGREFASPYQLQEHINKDHKS
jgi:hypothetical protein